jgi:hypothetical protein
MEDYQFLIGFAGRRFISPSRLFHVSWGVTGSTQQSNPACVGWLLRHFREFPCLADLTAPF